jgi:hypothetical protein
MSEHLDETGQPCTRHANLDGTRLYELATLGSRMPAFHHDAASKLQSLMMALDEISELGSSEPDMRTAIDTAHAALRELNQILGTNRALAKAAQKSRTGLAELVQRSAESFGVRVRGDIQAQDIRVAVPAVRHAVSLLLDLAAGPSHLGRVVDVTCTFDGDRYELTISGPPEAASKLPPNAGESLAIAKFVIDREDGELRCHPTGFVVRVPAAPPPSGAMPALPKP